MLKMSYYCVRERERIKKEGKGGGMKKKKDRILLVVGMNIKC